MKNNNVEVAIEKPELDLSAFQFSAFKLPVITLVIQFVTFAISYVQNCMTDTGIENGLLVLKETKSGRVSRQSAMKTIINGINRYIKAENTNDDGTAFDVCQTVSETCSRILENDFTLVEFFSKKVTKVKDENPVLVKLTNEGIQKAKANFNNQLRQSFLEVCKLVGKDDDGKQWSTISFTDSQLLMMIQSVAKHNLTAKPRVKILKKSELEEQIENLKAELAMAKGA